MTEDLLLDNEEYLKSGVHIGTKFKTKYMEPFIFKTRPDGLSVMDLGMIDERIRLAINLLSQYEAEDILIVSRRDNGWKALRALAELTGMKVITGRYPPGILTNTNLETFVEPKILMVCDPWPDKNAVKDAIKVGIPVIALCDTNNESNSIDFVVPANNKGKRSVGTIMYLIARGYMRNKGLLRGDQDPEKSIEEFVEE